MKSITALAIARAGTMLGLALDLVAEDETIPTQYRDKLLLLRPTATMLRDVPIPPTETGQPPPGPSAVARCDNCGQHRIIGGLSPLHCPTCGQAGTVTAV